MLRHPKNRKVLRAGRRLGKTATLAVMMLHYSYTHNHGRVLVLTPMKSQGEVIYKEMLKMVQGSDVVKTSITRAITAPYHVIEFVNGSIIRFFSTGLKSGGKSDVARGQEAHVIVLDELDYMGPEDLDAIIAMLQQTEEGQESKVLIGASTPTGRREKLWDWSHSNRFKEFWFPSYCNPFFNKEMEEEFREEYTEMVYRHEIEADWGEDLEGVYPRKWVELACHHSDWE
jgi:replicative DNA helicase